MIRRDTILLAGLFVALVVLIGLGPARDQGVPGSSATSHSSREGGTLALYRWLGALGYNVTRLQYQTFTPDPAADLLVVLAPSERYTPDEAEAVRAWVEAGGTLLVAEELAGAFAPAAPLLDAFGLRIEPADDDALIELAPVLQPALGTPPATRLQARTSSVIVAEEPEVAPLAGSVEAPVLVGVQHGEGYIYASSTPHLFTNDGLRDRENAAAVLNLLRRVPPEGAIVFDEIHHGFVGQPSLRTLLLGTPWGWAALYGAAVGAGYLALTGRRIGRPVPLRAEAARRSSAEYLESMAGLLRRAGKADYLIDHYRAGVRRRLARTYGLSPDLDDAALVEGIAASSPARARAAADLLARMARQPADEAAILALVAEGDALTER